MTHKEVKHGGCVFIKNILPCKAETGCGSTEVMEAKVFSFLKFRKYPKFLERGAFWSQISNFPLYFPLANRKLVSCSFSS